MLELPGRGDGGVGLLPLEDGDGRGERRAALPLLGEPRIAGVGEVPGPKSVPTSSVSWSFHDTLLFAAGRKNPPSTNCFLPASNSRWTLASEPPRERLTMQRR